MRLLPPPCVDLARRGQGSTREEGHRSEHPPRPGRRPPTPLPAPAEWLPEPGSPCSRAASSALLVAPRSAAGPQSSRCPPGCPASPVAAGPDQLPPAGQRVRSNAVADDAVRSPCGVDRPAPPVQRAAWPVSALQSCRPESAGLRSPYLRTALWPAPVPRWGRVTPTRCRNRRTARSAAEVRAVVCWTSAKEVMSKPLNNQRRERISYAASQAREE